MKRISSLDSGAALAMIMGEVMSGTQHPPARVGKRPGTPKTPSIRRRRTRNKAARKARRANRK